MDFQNTRFKLAECKTKAEVLRSFVNDCIARLIDGTLDAPTASMAKYYGTEIQNEIMHECLQLFGGYGYMMEYPIARLYADARVQMIYGGTNEIMKELRVRSTCKEEGGARPWVGALPHSDRRPKLPKSTRLSWARGCKSALPWGGSGAARRCRRAKNLKRKTS